MKNANLLIFITQLGLSVALPPAAFILLALWLRNQFGWGNWVLIAGVILGIICAIDGLRTTLKAMARLSKDKQEETPPMAFNDHE